MTDAARARREAAQAEAALRSGEPNAHELLIWRADAAHEAALCAGRVPDTVRRFLVRCAETRGGENVAKDGAGEIKWKVQSRAKLAFHTAPSKYGHGRTADA